MNWDAIGAVGEVAGAIAVIVTLVYLAAQIRQNSAAVRSATRQAVSTAQMEFGIQIATNPELRAATARWLDLQPAPASPDDRLRDDFFLRSALRMYENQYHHKKDGTFDEAMWSGYLENMRRLFHTPGFRDFWEGHRSLYSTDFAGFVQSEIHTEASPETG